MDLARQPLTRQHATRRLRADARPDQGGLALSREGGLEGCTQLLDCQSHPPYVGSGGREVNTTVEIQAMQELIERDCPLIASQKRRLLFEIADELLTALKRAGMVLDAR